MFLPIVENVTSQSTELNIANGSRDSSPLGTRASVTITMRDIPYDDTFVDKYTADRAFTPYARSSFWAKFLARNLYYQNRSIRIRDGYVGEVVTDMRTRNYVIDRIVGPDSNGRITITAKDVLKLAEDKRAQAPRASNGTIDVNISAVATSFNLTPAGIGNTEYPASGKGVVGSEVISFTRSSDAITVVARGANNTTAATHQAGDTFQLCLEYSDDRVDDVIADLLENYGNIDPAYLPTTDWSDEADVWLVNARVNGIITEPTGVTTLIGELCEQCTCFIWWDEIDQEIKFKPVRPTVAADNVVDIDQDSNVVAESLKLIREPNQRISQAWIYYKRFNPTESLTKSSNYSILSINADLEAETEEQYGESRVRVVYSRWLTDANAGQVLTLGSRLLISYRDNPQYITFSLDAKDRDIKVGDVVRLTHRSIVDIYGEPEQTSLQVISCEEVESGHRIEYKCQVFGFSGRFAFVMPDGSNDYGSATDDEKNTGGYICADSEIFSDGTEAYKII